MAARLQTKSETLLTPMGPPGAQSPSARPRAAPLPSLQGWHGAPSAPRHLPAPKPRLVGGEHTPRSRAGRVRGGAVYQLQRLQNPGIQATQTPLTSLPPQCKPAGNQPGRVTRRGPGAKTAEAGRVSPPLPPRRLLPLPRVLQHQAAEARGRQKPEEGGVGQGRRGHDSVPPDLTREPAREGAVPPAARGAPRSRSQATALSACRAAGKLLLLSGWRRVGGGHGRP
ncbi:translation initiation factor IF-2-like [Sturnira hondurensis]|uniref:translation initiation factor IF-2-like n=1 Tax=Sturnira hondurensis TaxID=192404 RepID=UPI00187A460A|nr:translation initiation factor IF-2-like [Sturnira hondurensis]